MIEPHCILNVLWWESIAFVLERVVDTQDRWARQDFVDEAPLDLVYVADHSQMNLIGITVADSWVPEGSSIMPGAAI